MFSKYVGRLQGDWPYRADRTPIFYGWWLVVGGWWLVVGGWWLVVGGAPCPQFNGV